MDWSVVTGITQVGAVPEQAPAHRENVEPVDGVAVSVTLVSLEKRAEHTVPQSMPAGELVTTPEPVPDLVTDTTWEEGPADTVTVAPAAVTEPTEISTPSGSSMTGLAAASRCPH